MTDVWNQANHINTQIEALKIIKDALPGQIEKCRAQFSTTMGVVDFERNRIDALGVTSPLLVRYVVAGSTVLLEYSTVYKHPVDGINHVIFSFYIAVRNEDAIFLLDPNDVTNIFAAFNNNLEKNILSEYVPILANSIAMRPLLIS